MDLEHPSSELLDLAQFAVRRDLMECAGAEFVPLDGASVLRAELLFEVFGAAGLGSFIHGYSL